VPHLLPRIKNMKNSISISTMQRRGKSVWRERWHGTDHVHRKFYSSKAQADSHAAKLRGEAVNEDKQMGLLARDLKANLLELTNYANTLGVTISGPTLTKIQMVLAAEAGKPTKPTSLRLSVVLAEMDGGLARLHTALRALGHPGLNVAVYDPDHVSPANLGRQLFSAADLGANKAQVLVNRINCFFNLQWQAQPTKLTRNSGQHWDFLIGCVDSAAARLELDRCKFHYWLDLGNSAKYGQVVLGEPPA